LWLCVCLFAETTVTHAQGVSRSFHCDYADCQQIMTTPKILGVAALLLLFPPPVLAASVCLNYESATVELTGLLRRHTFPGPPNYESLAQGDKAEAGYYLHLSKPICTVAGSEGEALTGVRIVQLVLSAGDFERLRSKLGRRITVAGNISAAVTGHHHAPVLLTVAKPVGRQP
jgi:hypothetical protein